VYTADYSVYLYWCGSSNEGRLWDFYLDYLRSVELFLLSSLIYLLLRETYELSSLFFSYGILTGVVTFCKEFFNRFLCDDKC
jgi:hypothetical protein